MGFLQTSWSKLKKADSNQSRYRRGKLNGNNGIVSVKDEQIVFTTSASFSETLEQIVINHKQHQDDSEREHEQLKSNTGRESYVVSISSENLLRSPNKESETNVLQLSSEPNNFDNPMWNIMPDWTTFTTAQESPPPAPALADDDNDESTLGASFADFYTSIVTTTKSDLASIAAANDKHYHFHSYCCDVIIVPKEQENQLQEEDDDFSIFTEWEDEITSVIEDTRETLIDQTASSSKSTSTSTSTTTSTSKTSAWSSSVADLKSNRTENKQGNANYDDDVPSLLVFTSPSLLPQTQDPVSTADVIVRWSSSSSVKEIAEFQPLVLLDSDKRNEIEIAWNRCAPRNHENKRAHSFPIRR